VSTFPMKLSSVCRNLLSIIIGVGTLTCGQSAIAAQSIVFRYGIFGASLSIQELTEFVRTGTPSANVRSFLRLANQQPESVRGILSQEIPVNVNTLDRLLDSPVGNVTLDRLGQTFQTPANVANRQALRGALIVSASRDNRLSLIEVLQNYPATDLVIDARQLRGNVTQFSELSKLFQLQTGTLNPR
jgi:hypothetical protein